MAYLVRIVNNRSQNLYLLDRPVTQFGRAEHCHIVLNDINVSREHARFERLDGQIVLIDNQSSNGTLVNDIPVNRMILSSGDRVRMGEHEMVFYEGSPEEVAERGRMPKLDGSSPVESSSYSTDQTDLLRQHADTAESQAMKTAYLQLKTLYRLNQELPGVTKIGKLFQSAAESLLLATGAERVCFWESAGVRLAHEPALIAHAEGLPESAQDQPLSERALRQIWKEHKALLFLPEQKAVTVTSSPLTQADGYSMLGAPIRHGEKSHGVAFIDNPSGEKSLGKIDLDFTSALAGLLGLFIERLSYMKSLENDVRTMSKKAGGATNIIGKSEAMRNIHAQIAQVAGSEATALIRGESGTGKELAARAIHQASRRHDRTFLAVNCAGLPEQLIESELFGYEKGAFTGAYARKIGHFEGANNGTLFLDEVGELHLTSQAKLLRVLQEGEIMRVGGSKPIRVDVRIVAATNRDLLEMVKAGKFREDLYYRLNVVEIVLPPLRDRREDIPVLADYFLGQLGESFVRGATLTSEAREALARCDWPGNIRQLRNAIEHALVMAQGEPIDPRHLPDYVIEPPRGRSSATAAELDTAKQNAHAAAATGQLFEPRSLADIEAEHIRASLKHFKRNKQKTAQSLGISRSTLYEKMKTYGIEK